MTRSQIATAKTMTAIKGEGDTARESNTISILQKQPKHHRQEKSSISRQTRENQEKSRKDKRLRYHPNKRAPAYFCTAPTTKIVKASKSCKTSIIQPRQNSSQDKGKSSKIKQNQGKTMIARPSHTRPPQQYNRNKNQRKAQR